MSDIRKDSDTQKSKRKDMAMIDSRIKSLVRQVFKEKNNKYQSLDKLVDEAFTRGTRDILASGKKPEKVEEKFLTDDDFKYLPWQLNLHPVDEKDMDWVDIKSHILLQGLKQISGEIRINEK